MTGYGIDRFIADCEAAAAANVAAADCVVAALPLMERLLDGDRSFLKPEHFRSDPAHYARNAIYVA
ncbi:MAG TPA: cysteine dioxygenase, partial [Alphaproteobacteria bacterium]|nr:cysteine dioxygenase [Alphaproteobacteria bacterium]